MKILLIDPDPPRVRWALIDSEANEIVSGPNEAASGEQAVIDAAAGGKPDAVAYVLQQGGDVFSAPVEPIREDTEARLAEVVPLMPECNTLTAQAVRCGHVTFGDASHLLLCETAPYTEMPEEASSYAVPPALRRAGLRRYGGRGLAHKWASEKIMALEGKEPRRIVTLMLAPATTAAAFLDGKAMETSGGFSPVEGIPSLTTCGDIDPTIVLHLRATGLRIEDINRSLTENSGLRALAGEDVSLREILSAADSEDLVFARNVYMYHLVKTIGAFAGALGGIDELVLFTGSEDPVFRRFARSLCENLSAALPISLKEEEGAVEAKEMTQPGSKVRVHYWTASRWSRLTQLSDQALQGGYIHA